MRPPGRPLIRPPLLLEGCYSATRASAKLTAGFQLRRSSYSSTAKTSLGRASIRRHSASSRKLSILWRASQSRHWNEGSPTDSRSRALPQARRHIHSGAQDGAHTRPRPWNPGAEGHEHTPRYVPVAFGDVAPLAPKSVNTRLILR